mgnify:CR=1 FL=1
MPLLGLRLSSAVVAPAAAASHHVDFRPFVALGCSVREDANYEVLKSLMGDDTHCLAYSQQRAAKQIQTLQAVAALDDPQVAYYLMRWSCNASRVNYLARTTPQRHCLEALQQFDAAMQDAFCTSTGFTLHPLAWEQATMPTKQGGLGLRSAASVADAAYIGSRLATRKRCQDIWQGSSYQFLGCRHARLRSCCGAAAM